MIEHRDGNLLEQKDLSVIMHQANCFNRMKSGIAKAISEKYPEAIEADNRTEPGDRKKLGSFTCGVGENDRIHIINLYGQYEYGTDTLKTDYLALRAAVKEFALDYDSHYIITGDPLKVGIPYKLGCCLAGGDWNEVYKIFQEFFEDDDRFHLVICKAFPTSVNDQITDA